MNILETITAQKRIEVARLDPEPVTVAQLRAALMARDPMRDFARALRQPLSGSMAVIAEVKKASPSAGVICPNFDPIRIAQEYEAGGAQCISVLTDEKFFQGSLADLQAVRQAVKLPLLRKDFIIDPRQIREAIHWGADAILLIVAILSDLQLRKLLELATGAGLAVLVETHDEVELDRALAAGAQMIGVNNRNLKTFEVDLATTEKVAAALQRKPDGKDILLVSESGIKTRVDVERLARCGARAILVGESLMRREKAATHLEDLVRLTITHS